MTAQVVNYETVWDMVKKLSLIQKQRMFNDLSRSIAIEDDTEEDGGLLDAIQAYRAALPPNLPEISDEDIEQMRYEALTERHPL